MKTESIKFKAKQLNSGKWFEGDLVHLGNRVCIGGDHIKDGITDVDLSTVCQFTGMMDEDCNEIWENDILLNVTNDSPNGIVVFKYGAFCLLAKNGRDFCVALKSLLTNKEWLTRFKVAGNKYDKKIVNY